MLVYNEYSRWYYHPAVQMWKGYELSLIAYGRAMCKEWIKRGYKDTTLPKFNIARGIVDDIATTTAPWCLHNASEQYEPMFSRFRSILLAKNPDWYIKFNWEEKPSVVDGSGNYPYLYPKDLYIDTMEVYA